MLLSHGQRLSDLMQQITEHQGSFGFGKLKLSRKDMTEVPGSTGLFSPRRRARAGLHSPGTPVRDAIRGFKRLEQLR